MKSINNYKVKIITGDYRLASKEQQEMLHKLFGTDAEYKYEIYFHWYNVIHELGHAIMMFNCAEWPHPAEEEQLVNNFAYAYWSYYGEQDKLEKLCEIVNDTIPQFIVPDQKNVGYIEYAKEKWGDEDFFTFNNYGWFQYSSVRAAMEGKQNLEQALNKMCSGKISPQEAELLKYTVSGEMPIQVVSDAVINLKKWGVRFPDDIEIMFSDDVNCHMCRVEDQITGNVY